MSKYNYYPKPSRCRNSPDPARHRPRHQTALPGSLSRAAPDHNHQAATPSSLSRAWSWWNYASNATSRVAPLNDGSPESVTLSNVTIREAPLNDGNRESASNITRLQVRTSRYSARYHHRACASKSATMNFRSSRKPNHSYYLRLAVLVLGLLAGVGHASDHDDEKQPPKGSHAVQGQAQTLELGQGWRANRCPDCNRGRNHVPPKPRGSSECERCSGTGWVRTDRDIINIPRVLTNAKIQFRYARLGGWGGHGQADFTGYGKFQFCMGEYKGMVYKGKLWGSGKMTYGLRCKNTNCNRHPDPHRLHPNRGGALQLGKVCPSCGQNSIVGNSSYKGGWEWGTRHGHGTYISRRNHKYEGEHSQGRADGEGTYTWPEDHRKFPGATFEGKWNLSNIGSSYSYGAMTDKDGRTIKGRCTASGEFEPGLEPKYSRRLAEIQSPHRLAKTYSLFPVAVFVMLLGFLVYLLALWQLISADMAECYQANVVRTRV